MLNYMAEERVLLSVDRQKRVSVGRLGLDEGPLVADRLSDGSGWVIRQATILTEAEVDILSRPENVENILKSLASLEARKITERFRRQD